MPEAFELTSIASSFDKAEFITLVTAIGGGVIGITLVVKGFQLVKRMIGRV